MIVWSRVAVETIRSDSRGKLLDLADFRKQIQVAVDGSKADIRKLFPDAGVKGVGGRMILPAHQAGFDRFALTAVF